MVSKNLLKFIKSLKIKKYRDQERLFLVEGKKNITELLQSDLEVVHLLGTPTFLQSLNLKGFQGEWHEASPDRLVAAGTYSTNEDGLAVVRIPDKGAVDFTSKEHIILLDSISDPGNLGTIMRTMDWFGFDQLVCSPDTVDVYSPKVISSSMGSFTRVKVFYAPLGELLSKNVRPVYGADLEGMDPAKSSFSEPSIFIFGSESHGLSKELSQYLTNRISIPKYGKAESLNVSIAAAIILNCLRS